MSQQAAIFAFYSIWGFIAINLILTLTFYITFKDLPKRYALILFNLFTTIAMATSTAISNSWLGPGASLYDNAKTVGFVSIFLVDLPNALAIVTWFFAHGVKPNRQQSVPSHSGASTDNASSIASILPTHNPSI